MRIADFIVAIKSKSSSRTNDHGNTVYHCFMPSDRYIIDFASDFKDQGWQQFDTSQDAHYFGAWVNPYTFWILSYAEGDWYLVECSDVEHYNAEIQHMIKFYEEGRIASVIDAEGRYTVYRQDRSSFLIK